jgi:hypothetical protein
MRRAGRLAKTKPEAPLSTTESLICRPLIRATCTPQPGQPTRQTAHAHPTDLGHGDNPPEDSHRPEVTVVEARSRSPLRQANTERAA